jgi:two-component system phosphate regulon response regulator PhoB
MKKKTILVVEDEKPLFEAIKKKLTLNNFEVIVARSVSQAFSYLEEVKHIDAIWLDHYLMGNENGLDLVVKLKEDGSEWKDLPIFVVSNTASDDKVSSYIEFGVTKYFVKSNTSLEEIVSAIQVALD